VLPNIAIVLGMASFNSVGRIGAVNRLLIGTAIGRASIGASMVVRQRSVGLNSKDYG
jgi:hypothetical protein